MKKTFILFLILLSFGGYAQKKASKQETQKSIYATIERIVYLHDQHYLANGIYAYTISWTCIPSMTEDHDVLVNLISNKLPAVHAPGTQTAEYDVIRNGLVALGALAEKNMQLLTEFDDYFDPRDTLYNPSTQAIEANQRLDGEFSKQFDTLTGAIEQQLAAEKQTLQMLLAKKTLPAGTADYITENLQAVEELMLARTLGIRTYAGSLNWLFRRQDAASKARLLKDLDTSVALVKEESSEDIETQVKLGQIDEMLSTNSELVKTKVTIIVTEDEYEDPITRLLAEDAIESTMAFNVTQLASYCEAILKERVEKLKTAVADDQTRKEDDIRRMLRDSKTIDLSILMMKKQIPDFNRDAFIELIVPAYAKRFSHDEIRQIVKFQKTSVGKKLNQYSADISIDIMKAVMDKMNTIKGIQKP